jgi:hypothetical protein
MLSVLRGRNASVSVETGQEKLVQTPYITQTCRARKLASASWLAVRLADLLSHGWTACLTT